MWTTSEDTFITTIIRFVDNNKDETIETLGAVFLFNPRTLARRSFDVVKVQRDKSFVSDCPPLRALFFLALTCMCRLYSALNEPDSTVDTAEGFVPINAAVVVEGLEVIVSCAKTLIFIDHPDSIVTSRDNE